jgi:hypothetical protein
MIELPHGLLNALFAALIIFAGVKARVDRNT